MGLYENKHLRTFHIEDGVKKIDYARINRLVLRSNTYYHYDYSHGATNFLLWESYNKTSHTNYCSHESYDIALNPSHVKHTHYDRTTSTHQTTPDGIEYIDDSGVLPIVRHLLIYNTLGTVNEIKTITYETN